MLSLWVCQCSLIYMDIKRYLIHKYMFPLMILHCLMRKCLTMYFFTYAMTSKETNTFILFILKVTSGKKRLRARTMLGIYMEIYLSFPRALLIVNFFFITNIHRLYGITN